MKLYEFITPSDPITFYAPDKDIAEAVALFIGKGKAGLRAVDESETPNTMHFFSIPKDVLGRVKNAMDNRTDEVVQSAHTFAVCKPEYREEYDILTKNGTDKDAVDKWDNKHRSSCSSWCEFARGIEIKEQKPCE